MFTAPEGRFWVGHGSYTRACDGQVVPRFRCKACRRTFSRQTFRYDYRERKPQLNLPLLIAVCSGIGIRQSARALPMSRKNTTRKFHRMGRHLGLLHENLLSRMPAGATFVLDEMITYEQDRSVCHVTMPLVVEGRSNFLVAQCAAPIRPGGKMTPQRRARLARHEARHGRRVDGSKEAVEKVLRALDAVTSHLSQLCLITDGKPLYGSLGRRLFAKRFVHVKVPSTLPRTPSNPLFPVNHCEALMRCLVSRFRRVTWLGSKRYAYAERATWFFAAYRNYVRRRTNREHCSPAMLLGFTDRRWEFAELITWRQDHGPASIHPTSVDGALSIAAARAAREHAA